LCRIPKFTDQSFYGAFLVANEFSSIVPFEPHVPIRIMTDYGRSKVSSSLPRLVPMWFSKMNGWSSRSDDDGPKMRADDAA
jgi:hypothetical protein